MAFWRAGVLACAAVCLSGQLSEDLKWKLDEAQRSAKAGDAGPVDVAPEPDEPERAIRSIRNRLHNSRLWNCDSGATNRAKSDGCPPAPPALEELPEGVPSKVTNVDFPPMPEVPVNFSDTIIAGTVNRVQPYLSEDRRNIYTEYTIAVSEILKDAKGLGLARGSVIAVDRMGGAVRLASGRVLRDIVYGQSAPLIAGHEYVLFLSCDARGAWFRCVKPWEIWRGVAVPGDPGDIAAAQQGRSRWTGKVEAEFMAAVRRAVREAGR